MLAGFLLAALLSVATAFTAGLRCDAARPKRFSARSSTVVAATLQEEILEMRSKLAELDRLAELEKLAEPAQLTEIAELQKTLAKEKE